jgi:hypothetical protein
MAGFLSLFCEVRLSLLVYDDSALIHQDRSGLIAVLSTHPLEFWDEVTVTNADINYYKFVEHNYNLSDLNHHDSVAELIVAIKAAKGVVGSLSQLTLTH